jgi:hypothetical protein
LEEKNNCGHPPDAFRRGTSQQCIWAIGTQNPGDGEGRKVVQTSKVKKKMREFSNKTMETSTLGNMNVQGMHVDLRIASWMLFGSLKVEGV